MAKKRISPRHNRINDLTAEYVRSILNYDPTTGIFIWKDGRRHAHKIAGCTFGGYSRIKINGQIYMAHRLAWLHFYGKWPGELDHKNRNGVDNGIDNLREASSEQNNSNRGIQANNTTGFKGVGYYKRYKDKKFRATIFNKGKEIFLGYFKTAEEAHQAYCEAAKKYHGEFARLK